MTGTTGILISVGCRLVVGVDLACRVRFFSAEVVDSDGTAHITIEGKLKIVKFLIRLIAVLHSIGRDDKVYRVTTNVNETPQGLRM